MKIIPLLRRYELLLQRTIWVYKMTGLITGGQSSRLEKKLTINSWKRHALCDSVFSERNRWKFEHDIRNSLGNEMKSSYNDKYFEIWTFYT